MSFSEFEQQIKSPAIRQVAQHWHEARGNRAMPDWSDIRPSAIATRLSIIWSYRYDDGADTFVGRIAGDQVEKVFGKTFRGTPMQELYPADQFPKMFERFRRVVHDPALYLEEGKVFQVIDHYGFGERIAMPLSRDGVVADGIFGATVYQTIGVTLVQPQPDDLRWFAL